MFLGQRFVGKTVGVIGAGRIGSAYARMMVEGHKMHLVYYDLYPNEPLEQYVADYSAFLVERGEEPLTCRRMESVDELLATADVVSLHTVLDESTHHLIDDRALAEARIFPALHISRSGTRKEERLYPPEVVQRLAKLRRVLSERKPETAMRSLITSLANYPTNEEFLETIPVG